MSSQKTASGAISFMNNAKTGQCRVFFGSAIATYESVSSHLSNSDEPHRGSMFDLPGKEQGPGRCDIYRSRYSRLRNAIA